MNNTYFFRLPRFWDSMLPFVINKYKDESKVNVYNYACSDGSEALSLLMALKSKFSDIAKKFFPILAVDYDEVAIAKAKRRVYEIGYIERDEINKHTDNGFNKYFTKINKNIRTDKNYIFSAEHCDDIKFEVANVLKNYKKIKSQNSLVMARNFWPYLSDADKVKLAEGLSDRMRKKCTLVIGEFDLENRWSKLDITKILTNAGFKQTDSNLIFEK